MKTNFRRVLLLIVPVLASWLLWGLGCYFLYIISYILMFICIGFCRYCRRHESIWLFILVGLSSIPVIIKVCLLVCGYLATNVFLFLLLFLLTYAITLSLLEIIIGVIGRLIWKDQCQFIEHGFEYDESNIISMLKETDRTPISA